MNMDAQDRQDKEESCSSCPPMLRSLIERGAALIVEKEKIAANGEYNLSGERYRESNMTTHTFPLVRIGDVCTINPHKSQLADLESNTRVSFVPMTDLNEHRMTFQPSKQKLLSEVSASYTVLRG